LPDRFSTVDTQESPIINYSLGLTHRLPTTPNLATHVWQ